MEFKFSKFDQYFLKKYLEGEEEVIYVIHKHWIEFVGPFLKWFIIGVILPIFFMWLYGNLYTTLIGLGCMIFVIGMGVYDFFDWYLDVLILTNRNIIQAEWNGFFSNFSTRMSYESIEGIGCKNEGVFASIFGYGDLVIEKENGELVFKNTANPKKVEMVLLDAKEEMGEGKKGGMDTDALKSLLSELVAEHLENMNIHKRGFRK